MSVNYKNYSFKIAAKIEQVIFVLFIHVNVRIPRKINNRADKNLLSLSPELIPSRSKRKSLIMYIVEDIGLVIYSKTLRSLLSSLLINLLFSRYWLLSYGEAWVLSTIVNILFNQVHQFRSCVLSILKSLFVEETL